MEIWLLLGLGLYLVQVFLEVTLYLPAIGFAPSLGARDGAPEKAGLSARAERALDNMKENLPIFLTLGLLSMIVEGVDMGQAIFGAQLFVLGRLVYVPLYIAGIPLARSLAYGVSLFGMILMAWAILNAGA